MDPSDVSKLLHYAKPGGPSRILYLSNIQPKSHRLGFILANGEKISEWIHWLAFARFAKSHKDESLPALTVFEVCQQAITNCQELYFLDDTATPILQTDASDYGIDGYVFMVTNGKVRVVRFFSKALVGAQLNWSVREKKCYGIFYGVRLFEDLLDNRAFILKTDHKNLTYLNVTLTGKILRWKLYLQDKVF